MQNSQFYEQKGTCLKDPLNWTGSSFPLLTLVYTFFPSEQKFQKGVSRHKGGWREQILPFPQSRTSCLLPWSYASLEEGGQLLCRLFAYSWKVLCFKTFISCYRTPAPQKGFRRGSEGVSEGFSEGLSKGLRRVLEGVSRGPF